MTGITSDTITYRGFLIDPSHRGRTGRPCLTVQAYIVRHPATGEDGRPCGWKRTLHDAKSDIDAFLSDVVLSASELAALDWNDTYLERMSVWFPASAAADALRIRAEQDKAKAEQEAQAAEERKRLERIRAAAPAMLAVLKEISHNASTDVTGIPRDEALALLSLIRDVADAAIAQAGEA